MKAGATKLFFLSILLIYPATFGAGGVLALPDIRNRVEFADRLALLNERGLISDLSHLHPAFRNKIIVLIATLHAQGIEVEVRETYRTPERQNRLRRKGKSMVRAGRSKHQYGMAVDIVPVRKNGSFDWSNKKKWGKIGRAGEALGLTWGGRWKKLYDPGHFELDYPIDSLIAGHWPVAPDTVIVPINF